MHCISFVALSNITALMEVYSAWIRHTSDMLPEASYLMDTMTGINQVSESADPIHSVTYFHKHGMLLIHLFYTRIPRGSNGCTSDQHSLLGSCSDRQSPRVHKVMVAHCDSPPFQVFEDFGQYCENVGSCFPVNVYSLDIFLLLVIFRP